MPKETNPIDLLKAVNLAYWLITEKNCSLSHAVRVGQNKFKCPYKSHVEKAVRLRFPTDYFKNRYNLNSVIDNQKQFSFNRGGNL